MPDPTSINNFNNALSLDGSEVFSKSSGYNGKSKEVKNLSKAQNVQKLTQSKKSNFAKTKVKRTSKTGFFIPKTREAFTKLQKTFTKVLILWRFDLKY